MAREISTGMRNWDNGTDGEKLAGVSHKGGLVITIYELYILGVFIYNGSSSS